MSEKFETPKSHEEKEQEKWSKLDLKWSSPTPGEAFTLARGSELIVNPDGKYEFRQWRSSTSGHGTGPQYITPESGAEKEYLQSLEYLLYSLKKSASFNDSTTSKGQEWRFRLQTPWNSLSINGKFSFNRQEANKVIDLLDNFLKSRSETKNQEPK